MNIKEFIRVESLEEAYELNKNKNNVIIGGNCWLRQQDRNILKAIDLSKLSLEGIKETEDSYKIGCMTSLREIEENKSLDIFSDGAIKESLKHIVGIQFRNCATIGGTIYGRFGFSDVLTCFLTMDTYVEMYKGGIISLKDFINLKYDEDILINVIIKKSDRKVAYESLRNSSTDFPILNCGAAIENNKNVFVVLGARPGKAKIVYDEKNILSEITDENIEKFANHVSESLLFSDNLRASGEYRKAISKVLIKRTINKIKGGK